MTKERIDSLTPYPGNPRRGNIDTIAESLKHLGQYRPIIANRGTHAPALARTILAGNHTTMAARLLGWDTIDVHWVDVDTTTAKRIVLVDNKTGDDAGYDVEALVNLATELPDLTATGFTRDELDTLLETLDTPDTPPDSLTNSEPPAVIGVIVECDTTDQRDQLKETLIEEGYRVGDL